MLFRNVDVAGSLLDVRISGARIAEVGFDLAPGREQIVDGRGGALLPGLHDHHIHLLALAAARASVDCSTATGLRLLALAPGDGWVRGTGYHESVAGVLDRHSLDRLVPERPVRVQHRSGALWILNSRALAQVEAALDGSDDVERERSGEPTGRLWRYDERLRRVLPGEIPELSSLPRLLRSYGITGVTDATPDLDPRAVSLIAHDISPHVDVTLLGAIGELPNGMRHGPWKLLLRDHDLPGYDELLAAIGTQHSRGRPVAIHCVTRESLLLTVAALGDVGTVPGDRIEHAAVVPAGIAAQLASLGVAVVTQPSFIRLRGEQYRTEVAPEDLPCLYPYGTLLRSGVKVAASSDAPFGDLDPWRTIRDAAQRLTRDDVALGREERVDTTTALAGYLSTPEHPGGKPRMVATGARANLCLLRVPLAEAMREPSAGLVRLVMFQGSLDDWTAPGEC